MTLDFFGQDIDKTQDIKHLNHQITQLLKEVSQLRIRNDLLQQQLQMRQRKPLQPRHCEPLLAIQPIPREARADFNNLSYMLHDFFSLCRRTISAHDDELLYKLHKLLDENADCQLLQCDINFSVD